MARASVALLVLLAAAPLAANERAAPRCEPGKPHPDAPAELSEFAFLVGDYEITSHAWTGQGWSPPRPGARARWNGWYGMGGMMIYDEWYDPDPGLDPSSGRGVNVRLYDPEEKLWKMMWIATVGKQTQDLRAQVQDGKLVMWQVHPERPGFRAEFTVEDEDHWHRVSFVPDENGGWKPQFKLAATRIPCPG